MEDGTRSPFDLLLNISLDLIIFLLAIKQPTETYPQLGKMDFSGLLQRRRQNVMVNQLIQQLFLDTLVIFIQVKQYCETVSGKVVAVIRRRGETGWDGSVFRTFSYLLVLLFYIDDGLSAVLPFPMLLSPILLFPFPPTFLFTAFPFSFPVFSFIPYLPHLHSLSVKSFRASVCVCF